MDRETKYQVEQIFTFILALVVFLLIGLGFVSFMVWFVHLVWVHS